MYCVTLYNAIHSLSLSSEQCLVHFCSQSYCIPELWKFSDRSLPSLPEAQHQLSLLERQGRQRIQHSKVVLWQLDT